MDVDVDADEPIAGLEGEAVDNGEMDDGTVLLLVRLFDVSIASCACVSVFVYIEVDEVGPVVLFDDDDEEDDALNASLSLESMLSSRKGQQVSTDNECVSGSRQVCYLEQATR